MTMVLWTFSKRCLVHGCLLQVGWGHWGSQHPSRYAIMQYLNPNLIKAPLESCSCCIFVIVLSRRSLRYYVNRDTLFCYHKASEVFLQRLMALYVSSHYKVRDETSAPAVNGFSSSQTPRGGLRVPLEILPLHPLLSASVPELTQWPPAAVRRSRPSPLLSPASCAPHAELPARGPGCGAGTENHFTLSSFYALVTSTR